jgi:hypothetical protein
MTAETDSSNRLQASLEEVKQKNQPLLQEKAVKLKAMIKESIL